MVHGLQEVTGWARPAVGNAFVPNPKIKQRLRLFPVELNNRNNE